MGNQDLFFQIEKKAPGSAPEMWSFLKQKTKTKKLSETPQ